MYVLVYDHYTCSYLVMTAEAFYNDRFGKADIIVKNLTQEEAWQLAREHNQELKEMRRKGIAM